MKLRFLIPILTLASALLTGCGTSRNIPMQTVREVAHDTLYFNRIQYDSIYVDKFRSIDRGRDTIFVVDNHVEYRYKLLRDTVRVVQIDSIPVIKTIEVMKTERYTPWYAKALSAIGIISLIVIALYILKKIYLK